MDFLSKGGNTEEWNQFNVKKYNAKENNLSNVFGKNVRFKTGGIDPREYAYNKSKNSKSYRSIYTKDKKEYATFISNVNAEYWERHAGRSISSQFIGDYNYIFEVYDFNSYNIIGRRKIEDTNTGLKERDIDT